MCGNIFKKPEAPEVKPAAVAAAPPTENKTNVQTEVDNSTRKGNGKRSLLIKKDAPQSVGLNI